MRAFVLALTWSLVFPCMLAVTAHAQAEAWRVHGASSLPELGASVAWLPDLDGDGVADFVAGGPANDPIAPPAGTGHVLLCSGATASIRFDWTGAVGAAFGTAVARAGDADGDGVEDVAIGAPLEGGGNVYVNSGATGALLRTLSGSAAGSRFGASLASLGDVDGDGVADFAVGAPTDASGGTRLGLAVIVSGASGAVLASFTGASIDGQFGSVVADAGDVDGDGIHDLLVVEQADAGHGSLSVWSGATFQRLRGWNLGAETSGWTARGAGDVNGDGFDDVVVGNSRWPLTPKPWNPFEYFVGGVWVLDGATGATLDQFTQFDHVGWAVSGAGDVDGDGFADYAFALSDAFVPAGLLVLSGKSGAVLAQSASAAFLSLAGGVDASGDGVPDLLFGSPDPTNGFDAGAAGVLDLATNSVLCRALGTTRVDFLGRSSALLDDVNGDGTRDLLVSSGGGIWGSTPTSLGYARVLSGVDGSELRFHAGTAVDDSYALRVAALPDLDGDGIGEYAITVPGAPGSNAGRIEIRSGATGNLTKSLAPSGGSGTGTFGASCAVAIQPSGAVQIAVGAPEKTSATTAFVFDVASGGVVTSFSGATPGYPIEGSIAYLGDMDGDGTGDWVVGSPYADNDQGSVVVFSGQTGAVLHAFSTPSLDLLGASVGGPGDLDGDGTPDLLVGAPGWLNGFGGVFLYSGATWSRLHTWKGDAAHGALGVCLTVVGDVNHDGLDDFLLGHDGEARLVSGRGGGMLFRFDDPDAGAFFATTSAGVAAPGSKGSMNGDAVPDLAISAYLDSTNGFGAGRLALYLLAELYLQIDPPVAPAGQPFSFTTSGGPSGNFAAVFATGFDGTPMFVLAALGTLDAQGTWKLSGTIPPGLAGHTATFQSFTVGFAGKLARTQPMTLTFE